ncbi:MAG: hypothetical protein HQ537_02535 [Parcubacteria group bacterium]|nr:hypothetical protein [Parcubacteria group bacterium]
MLKRIKNNIKPLTKKDLKKTIGDVLESQSKTILKAVDFEFRGIDERFNDIDKRLYQMDGKIDKVLDGQDRFVKQLTDLGQESKVSTELYKNHDKKIEGHEKRIDKLELKTES